MGVEKKKEDEMNVKMMEERESGEERRLPRLYPHTHSLSIEQLD